MDIDKIFNDWDYEEDKKVSFDNIVIDDIISFNYIFGKNNYGIHYVGKVIDRYSSSRWNCDVITVKVNKSPKILNVGNFIGKYVFDIEYK